MRARICSYRENLLLCIYEVAPKTEALAALSDRVANGPAIDTVPQSQPASMYTPER